MSAVATRPKSKRPTLTPEQRDAKRAELTAKMAEAVAELATSEGWMRHLEVSRRFHRYSFGNRLLILRQCPDATRVAGFNTWKTLGRSVVKGERGIAIWSAPFLVEPKGGSVQLDENGEPVKIKIHKIVYVFDVSQTEGEPLPELESIETTGDELEANLRPLEGLARELGFVVEYRDLSDDARGGWCNYSERRIVVDSSTCGNVKVATLVHELAHAMGVSTKAHGRSDAETIVESVAYVTLGLLGVDTSGFSVPYVAGWSGGDAKALRESAELVSELVKRFEAVLILEGDDDEAEGGRS